MSDAIGVVSFGAAAAAYALLTLLLAISQRGKSVGVQLIVASAATCAWATALAIQAATGALPVLGIYLVEVLCCGAWLYFLCLQIRQRLPKWVFRIAIALGVIAVGVDAYRILSETNTLLVARTALALTLASIILLVQVFRHALPAQRLALRYFGIGLGGVFAANLFISLHAEVTGTTWTTMWSARGAMALLAVPFIAVAARRHPDWSFGIFVSRQAVYYATAIITVGMYLTATIAGSYIVEDLAGAWGPLAQIAFIVLGLLGLVALVVSTSVRRRLAVFINKHFYSNKYDYRIEWLRFIETLSSTEEGDVRTTAARAVAQILESPGALLFTKESGGHRFVPTAAWPIMIDQVPGLDSIDANSEFIRFLAERQWIIDTIEYRTAPEVYQNITLPPWLLAVPHLRIVSPMLRLKELVGFFVLYDPPAPFELTFEDRDLLKTVGRHVAIQLAQHEADRRLAESRQFEAYNRLTAFMMHDLKNSVAQLQLIVDNSVRHKRNPEFIDDAIETIRNTVERMSNLIEQLRSRRDLERLEKVDLAAVVHQAASRCAGRQPKPVVEVVENSNVMAHQERLISVVEHILRNAQDATAENGSISVVVSRTAEGALVTVRDTGIGMEPDFVRDRLFRPFDSTKGSKGMGIGAYQVREYIRSLGGNVEIQSKPKVGTSFLFTLPCFEGERAGSEKTATLTQRPEEFEC